MNSFYLDIQKRQAYTHVLINQNFPLYEDKVALVYRLQQALVMGVNQLELEGRTGLLTRLDYKIRSAPSYSFSRGAFANIIGPKAQNVAVISSIRTLTRFIEEAAATASESFDGSTASCKKAANIMCAELIHSCNMAYREERSFSEQMFNHMLAVFDRKTRHLCYEFFYSSLRAADFKAEIIAALNDYSNSNAPLNGYKKTAFWAGVIEGSLKLNSEINFYTLQNFVYDCKAYYYRKTNQGASKDELSLLMNKNYIREAFWAVARIFDGPRLELNTTYHCLRNPAPYLFFFCDKPKGYVNPML